MLNAKYSFPHIEFAETIVGSVPTQNRWRGVIGVAGQFRRGPQQYLINDRQTFARLYGEDSSPGAKAVRQMLALGATDILVSRAIMQALPATSSIFFTSLTPGTEARVGFEGQVQQFNNGTPVQTTGLKATLNYISDALPGIGSVGEVTVKPNSRLNNDLVFDGQAEFQLVVEDRVSTTVELKLASPGLGTKSKTYVAIAAVSYTALASGTLISLNAAMNPTNGSAAIANGDTILFTSGVQITVDATGTYTVITGGSVALNEVANQVVNIPVENVLAPLDIGSTIYYNNAEIATVVIGQVATNAPVNLRAITKNTGSIATGASFVSVAKIANATIRCMAGATSNQYKYLQFSSSLYPAFSANLKPGRVLQSKNPNVVFGNGYLTIVGLPILDPIISNTYNILVKGTITNNTTGTPATIAAALDALEVSLYDAPTNAYVFSSTFNSTITSKTHASASRIRNKYYIENRGVLVDSFHIAQEAYNSTNLSIELLYEHTDGQVFAVDSGLILELPPVVRSGILAFLKGSNYKISVTRATAAVGAMNPNDVPFEKGTAASLVLKQLVSKILQDNLMTGLLDNPELNENLTPVSLSLKTRITGASANRVYFELERSTKGEDIANGVYANDLLLNSTNLATSRANWSTSTTRAPKYFTDAAEGSQAAFTDYYSSDSDLLVKIVALSEGAYGNKIKISINPTGLGQFVVTAIDEDSSSYQTEPTVETLSLSTRDVNASTGVFNATSNSSLIRAYYVPIVQGKTNLTEVELNKVPYRIAPAFGTVIPSLSYESTVGGISKYSPAYQGASYLQNIYLEKGRDALVDLQSQQGLASADVMRRAVQRLEEQDVAILYLAGVLMGDSRYSGVIEEAIGQVNRATTNNGKRRLIIQAPPNLNQDQARLFSAQLNNENVSLVAGHCSVLGISNANTEHAAPFYAAVLSLSAPHISPAFIGNGVQINLVRSVDTLNNPQYLDALTRAGVEALVFDAGLKAFKFLNGRNTSAIPEKRQVSIRRVADEIINSLYINLQPLKSGPNSDQLRALISSSCDAYLNSLVQDGWIQAFSPTICSLENNPVATQALNQVRIRINYLPVFPGDIFLVDVVQSIVQDLDLTLG